MGIFKKRDFFKGTVCSIDYSGPEYLISDTLGVSDVKFQYILFVWKFKEFLHKHVFLQQLQY